MGSGLPSRRSMGGTISLISAGPMIAAVDAEELVELGPQPQPVDGRLGVADVEPSHLVEQQVEPQLARQPLVQLVALAEEGDRLGRQVVRPDDGRATRARAAAQVVLVEHRHVGDTHLAQVMGRGQPMNPPADDHHIVRVLDRVPAPHLVLPEYHRYPCRLPGWRRLSASVPKGSIPYRSPASTRVSHRYSP